MKPDEHENAGAPPLDATVVLSLADLAMRTRAKTLDAETRRAAAGSIVAGDCPYCGKSGFKVVAIHVFQAHGLTTRELRDGLGLTFTESICAPEHSEQIRKRQEGKAPKVQAKDMSRRVYSDKGKAVVIGNLSSAPTLLTRNQLAEAGRLGGSKNKGQRRSEVEHGTRREFKKGCRCASCTEANRVYWREYRQGRQAQHNDRANLTKGAADD